MRLIQFQSDDSNSAMRLGLAVGNEVIPLDAEITLYELAQEAISKQSTISQLIENFKRKPKIAYDELFETSRIRTPIHHPDPSHCLITGTGLTHLNSVLTRQSMHFSEKELTDEIKIYQSGLNHGRPNEDQVGSRPEWFFKGFGYQLKASGEPLEIPKEALDAGEEAEIAVIYVIDFSGEPYRIGFCLGNEFSDHQLEQENHYYLAESKLRQCSIGPEIYLGKFAHEIQGEINIERNKKEIWKQTFRTGSNFMIHSLENIEHHIFKHECFRCPGDVHILFLGADKISYADDVHLLSGDEVSIQANLFQHPLKNKIKSAKRISHTKVQTL